MTLRSAASAWNFFMIWEPGAKVPSTSSITSFPEAALYLRLTRRTKDHDEADERS
jgi:hypothetical protein